MSRKSVVGVCLLVAMALASLGVSSASAAKAPRWKDSGAFLASGVTKSFVGTSTTTVDLTGAGLNLTSPAGSCTITGEISGSAAGAPGTNENVVLKCVKVTVVGAPLCTANSPGQPAGTVVTNKLTSTLVYLNKKSTKVVGDLFKGPESKFVTVEVKGEECAIAGSYPVTEEIVGKFVQEGESEFETGSIEFPTTKITEYYANAETETATKVNALRIKGNEKTTFTGTFSVELSPKTKIGVYQG